MSAYFRNDEVRSARALQRPIMLFVLAALAALAPMRAGAGQVTIAANADAVLEDSNGDGAFDKMNPASIASNGIYVENFLGGYPNFEDRAVVLFSLGGLLPGFELTDVVLQINETSNFNSVGGIAVEGYSSSGNISLADATASGSLLGSFDSTLATGVRTIVLDTGYVQSLLNSGATYLGVRLQGTARTVGATFDSIEQSRASAPSLTVTYVAEPPSVALLVSGLVVTGLGMRFRAKRRRTV